MRSYLILLLCCLLVWETTCASLFQGKVPNSDFEIFRRHTSLSDLKMTSPDEFFKSKSGKILQQSSQFAKSINLGVDQEINVLATTGDGETQSDLEFMRRLGSLNGNECFKLGKDELKQGKYINAADAFLAALTKHYQPVGEAFSGYLQGYIGMQKLSEAYVRLAKGYIQQNDLKNAEQMLLLAVSPGTSDNSGNSPQMQSVAQKLLMAIASSNEKPQKGSMQRQEAMRFYEYGSKLFALHSWAPSLQAFEHAYKIDPSFTAAFCNMIYLKSRVCLWESYAEEMAELQRLGDQFFQEFFVARQAIEITHYDTPLAKVQARANLFNRYLTTFQIAPHMTLAMPLSPELKLNIAKFEAEKIELHAFMQMNIAEGFQYDHAQIGNEFLTTRRRIRIGYVSADFKLKATTYLLQDYFKFHDRSKFEVFCFAIDEDSDPVMIERLGINWRKDIIDSLEPNHFFDLSKRSIFERVKTIHTDLAIDVLVNMDGYSNNGLRDDVIFSVQSAPVQISWLVYVGTMGADYIQYVVTDAITSPIEYEHTYSEKFIYMPNSFFANSHKYIDEIESQDEVPGYECEGNATLTKKTAFRFCNFNKHLKISPDMFSVWLNASQQLTDDRSLKIELVLLEYPADSKVYISDFISKNYPRLQENDRFQLIYLPFIEHPYEHQKRIAKNCDVVVDTEVYNAHTMAVDTLWANVPIITLNTDGTSDRLLNNEHRAGATSHVNRNRNVDMGSRVVLSILETLDRSSDDHILLNSLVARDFEHYIRIMKSFATDDYILQRVKKYLKSQRDNDFWNLEKYAGYFDKGIELIFHRFIEGKQTDHVYIPESK